MQNPSNLTRRKLHIGPPAQNCDNLPTIVFKFNYLYKALDLKLFTSYETRLDGVGSPYILGGQNGAGSKMDPISSSFKPIGGENSIDVLTLPPAPLRPGLGFVKKNGGDGTGDPIGKS